MLGFVYDYNHFRKFDNYMFNFLLLCFFKNFSHFSSIDVTASILRRWRIVCVACGTVWCGFGGVSVCAACGTNLRRWRIVCCSEKFGKFWVSECVSVSVCVSVCVCRHCVVVS
jgi:hypothetical protein